jgi:hypothetical protein
VRGFVVIASVRHRIRPAVFWLTSSSLNRQRRFFGGKVVITFLENRHYGRNETTTYCAASSANSAAEMAGASKNKSSKRGTLRDIWQKDYIPKPSYRVYRIVVRRKIPVPISGYNGLSA